MTLHFKELVMNERIEKLAALANQKALTDIARTDIEVDSTEFNTIMLEKFAGLIVQECFLYLNNEAERLYGLSASEHNPDFKANFELCAEKCHDNMQGLKEHFGVE